MPLVMLDAAPSGQVIVNTDDIVLIRQGPIYTEIVLRGIAEPVALADKLVEMVARELRDLDNVVDTPSNS